MNKKEPEEIDVFFTESSDYRTVYVSGAWGGVNPKGDIIADYYVERVATPNKVTMLVEGEQIKSTKIQENQRAIREKQISVVMRPNTAYSIGIWLVKKAKEAGFPVKINIEVEKEGD